MMRNLIYPASLALAFLPFFLLIWLDVKANLKKPVRVQQVAMPVAALIYCVVSLLFMENILGRLAQGVRYLAALLAEAQVKSLADWLLSLLSSQLTAVLLVLFNTLMLLCYVILKKLFLISWKRSAIDPDSLTGAAAKLIYTYDSDGDCWYVKESLGQARSFFKIAYYGGMVLLVLIMLFSCTLAREGRMTSPYYPAFALILLGELVFFLDGAVKGEIESSLSVTADQSRRIAVYPLLRNPLRQLLDDKLSAEGTTVNNAALRGGSVEDILVHIEQDGTHLSRNYSAFIRKKMNEGLKPHPDYIRSGYELAAGKSLLFNTPFYYKLQPYAFYAMQRRLLEGRKVLIILGRHGTEEDLIQWCRTGMEEISNIPDLWTITTLTEKAPDEDHLPDIGIISRSGVHDLALHKANLPFLRQVGFVVIVEPSRLVTTAQIGLNLLVQNLHETVTYCSVDRNCDGLVDTLSHILMTSLTEVAATEFPSGISSYMCWTADGDYVQHRIIPGVSRYLGMGTELSFIALKNQVRTASWYGGEAFPVLDVHWIAKQYYHDLLEYAGLPGMQETFDQVFETSFNLCNQQVCDYFYATVEDDRNNLFEIRRNFATIAQQQGFVNVISSEYMLREYMTENTQLFTADPKAIPYLTADYARTLRNSVLRLCLRLCLDGITHEGLARELMLMGLDAEHPDQTLWQEMCRLFGQAPGEEDCAGNPILLIQGQNQSIRLEKKNTLSFARRYSVERGNFVGLYTIESSAFGAYILEDLQSATYVAEKDSQDYYLGTELKSHIYQKYLPGQFFTLNGKYYEMVRVASGNRILVRRASEHINGRKAYRQVRSYTIIHLEDSETMGECKTVNGIRIHVQFADFSVATSGYWRMQSYNAFAQGALVEVNGIPTRAYHHKQLLRLDFSQLGEAFTDQIRVTLTNLINEVFVTLFAENAPFIAAVTTGQHGIPLTYHLDLTESEEALHRSIFIIEDSQLDLGLLIAVERNLQRIFQIISDYLDWNREEIDKSKKQPEPPVKSEPSSAVHSLVEKREKKKNIFARFWDWLKSFFTRRKKTADVPAEGHAAPPVQEQLDIPAKAKPEKQSWWSRLKSSLSQKKEGDAAREPAQQKVPAAKEAVQADAPGDEAEEEANTPPEEPAPEDTDKPTEGLPAPEGAEKPTEDQLDLPGPAGTKEPEHDSSEETEVNERDE